MAGIRYTAGQGDCLSTIARRFGVPWEKIWEHPENAALKRRRGDPDVLARGDELFVPYPEEAAKEVSAATGAVHRFAATLPPPEVRVRFLGGGAPRKGKKYVLVERIDICVDPTPLASVPGDPDTANWRGQYHVVRALVRLVIDARQQRQVPRTFGTAVEVSVGYGVGSQTIHSLDPQRWKQFGEAR